MAGATNNLDWSLLQAFLAVAEGGSLSEAARRLSTSQPTVGRHIQTLEDTLEVVLFQRQPRGMALTDKGREFYEHAHGMKTAFEAARLAALGESGAEAGTVRVTASVFVSHHILPALFGELRRLYPEISLDLVASDRSENLLFREADIAIRMYRPRQLDMVARHIGNVRLGLFGAESYFVERGDVTAETMLEHDFVGYDRNEEIIRGFRAQGREIDRDFFVVRTDNQTAYWELVRQGCGLGFGQVAHAQKDPTLRQVPLDFEIPPMEVWLTAHERVRRVPRVARVWELLADRLAEHCDGGSGRA